MLMGDFCAAAAESEAMTPWPSKAKPACIAIPPPGLDSDSAAEPGKPASAIAGLFCWPSAHPPFSPPAASVTAVLECELCTLTANLELSIGREMDLEDGKTSYPSCRTSSTSPCAAANSSSASTAQATTFPMQAPPANV
ncbi:hypothetical protein NEOLI_002634 [Neolecta irregularis DAH-3]|uniref:Uncharacterized protein n=1 Tax=Neolecta irregularis (strain DAH-3) TaxID=1198029 RepID=A0A1U7LRR4_NEOID|nr:hypothetical protein NEOLI_002634 [Neolecta irregularis DAH-3]|eukprot:OLL25273.1 hypothetical protein NEOLI_002634 [Neolecta irregularis DAH-3]